MNFLWLYMITFVATGYVYTRCYVTTGTSYGNAACHYSDVASASTNLDAYASAQWQQDTVQ